MCRVTLAVIATWCLIMPVPSGARDNTMQMRPYGTWSSPLGARDLVAGSRDFSELGVDGATLYFIESRPEEVGRQALMRRRSDGVNEEITGAQFNVRSRVHEYGGGALSMGAGTIYFTHFNDQSLYRLVPGGMPEALSRDGNRRFADCIEDKWRGRLICVLEDHAVEGEPRNSLVSISSLAASEPRVIFSESDFVAALALSADGRRVAFLSWKHPNMPWDDVQMQVAELREDGSLESIATLNRDQREAVLAP